jgi:DNA-binding MarR family transcriptional regulator
MAGIMESTTANVVRQMEAKGQISRRHLGKNMRKQHVFLTEKGKKMEYVLVPLAKRVNSAANKNINERDIKALRKTLIKMIENLGSEELNSK